MTVPTPDRNHTEQPLSPAMEDYLKSIYRFEEQKKRVTTQGIADSLGVAPASATAMIKRLAGRGLVAHERYYSVALTESGRRVAEEMIRHHRLLELYLTHALGFSGDQVHAEAERLEHFISEQLEERIDQMLGRPTHDPHGSPIPQRPNRCEPATECTLSELDLGASAVVLCSPALDPEARVVLLGRPLGAKLHVRVGDQEMLVDPELASETRVRRH